MNIEILILIIASAIWIFAEVYLVLIVISLPTIALLYRIKIEEEALVKGIGTEYEAYKKKTKKLIPGIW